MIATWHVCPLYLSICWMQAPATNWIRVIESMDHEGFYIPNQEAFSFFMSLYRCACQVYFY
jgi:CCR4-NOT transcription complex subunit 1